MLSQLDCRIFGLESIKEQYANDADFQDVLLHCKEGRTWDKYVINDGLMGMGVPNLPSGGGYVDLAVWDTHDQAFDQRDRIPYYHSTTQPLVINPMLPG
jgi:hypothetical protein